MRASRLIHNNPIGTEVIRSIRIVLCKVRDTTDKFLEPKAWLQRGSIPMARPDKTE